jgi:Cu2+-exporting ATPase
MSMTNTIPVDGTTNAAASELPRCFHCDLPIPAGTNISVDIDQQTRPMCCYGCAAVSNAIVDGGLENFYQFRDQPTSQGQQADDQDLKQLLVYDNPSVQASFVQKIDNNRRRASLMLEGIHCAACIWLNEQYLLQQAGVISADINYATHRASIEWDCEQIKLSDILGAIRNIGYKALPYDPGQQQQRLQQEQRNRLKQLGVAAALGMQVMIFAVALYAGDWFGIEDQYRSLFSWISLVLTVPVLLYSGRTFFQSAYHNIRLRQIGMDVPVSLGLALAFAASTWSTVKGSGHIYFDAVVMFIFFLLLARYVEFQVRRRVSNLAEQATLSLPFGATRIDKHDRSEHSILAAELKVGDWVQIRPGETIPADVVILEGHGHVNESLLTGESVPLSKTVGADLIGGSINIDQPLLAEVTRIGSDTVWAHMARLVEQAIHQKPAINRLVDRIAGYFVAFVLLAAATAAWVWYPDEQWLSITIAVLVVTCPCALSLATPTALAAATTSLTRQGLLITNSDALETLQRADHFIFDKTGTITSGHIELVDIHLFNGMDNVAVLQIAASLEQGSEHPMAKAIARANKQALLKTQDSVNTAGSGISATIDNRRYTIGNPVYISKQCLQDMPKEVSSWLAQQMQTAVLLADSNGIIAGLVLQDKIRDGMQTLMQNLKASGKSISLFSGDQDSVVQRVAKETGIDNYRARQSPADKLQALRRLQDDGAIVAMIGDGINDAPVLAAANVSIAIAGAAAISKASADIIMLDNNLSLLNSGIATARKTFRIIRQNLAWAIAYNVIALPLAITGHIAPWLAAIGMSASSLLVVLNARRLTRPHHK